MIDRTAKFLLTVIALLLLALLVRPALTPAQAQATTAPATAPPQLAVSNGTVYVLQNGKLSVYLVETKASKQLLSNFGFGGPVTLRRVATQEVAGP